MKSKSPPLLLGTLKLCLDKIVDSNSRRSDAVISHIRRRIKLSSRLRAKISK